MSSSIKVVVRFRPTNKTEDEHGGGSPIEFPVSGTEVEIKGGHASQNQFTYDDVFQPHLTQEQIFESVGIPTIENVIKGYNGTVLAYGQTGSGKTHSMLGPEGGTVDALSKEAPAYQHRGIIPRLVEKLYERLEKMPSVEVTWKVSVSVFELYKEGVHDLLTEDTSNKEYRIREDTITGRGVYVENLFAKQCLSASELLEAVKVGVSRRKVASTKSNETSSRSHSVTVINCEQVNHVQGGVTTMSRLNLVDLAGSEKVAKTQAGGERLKEAQMINLSLTLLGNVIYKLTDGKSAYIPYRDSKLTRILQDSFGGNSMTTLMCHCSPAAYNKEETVSTLRFASRAKQIKNKPRVNRELSAKELQLAYAQALDRIRQLEERLAMHDKIGAPPSPAKRSRNKKGEPGSPSSPGEQRPSTPLQQKEDDDELRAMVDDLMKQIEELRQELFEKEEMLVTANEQVEFYKKRAAEAEEAMQMATSKLKREQTLWERRIKDLESQQQLGGLGVTGQKTGSASNSSNNRFNPKEKTNISGKPSAPLARKGSMGRKTTHVEAMGSAQVKQETIETMELTPIATLGEGGSGGVGGSSSNLNNNRSNSVSEIPSDKEIEMMLRLEKMEEEMKKLKKENEIRAHHETELTSQVDRINVEVESAHAAKDESERELDSLRKLLQAKEVQNAKMKRILEQLEINIDDQEIELGDAYTKNKELANETNRLSSLTDELKQTQQQQEYCEMAQMELMVKAEDMDAIESDIESMAFSALNSDVFSATKISCLQTIVAIEQTMTTISNQLSRGKFNTSNLEGTRLNLINECAEFVSRCSTARAALTA